MSSAKEDEIASLQQELLERKEKYGENDKSVADTLNVLGLRYHHFLEDHDKAIEMHKEALRILKLQESNEDNLMNIAITLADLGNCYWKGGEFDKAKDIFTRSLEIFQVCQASDKTPKAKFCKNSVQNKLGILCPGDKKNENDSTNVPPKVESTKKNRYPSLTLTRPGSSGKQVADANTPSLLRKSSKSKVKISSSSSFSTLVNMRKSLSKVM